MFGSKSYPNIYTHTLCFRAAVEDLFDSQFFFGQTNTQTDTQTHAITAPRPLGPYGVPPLGQ